MNINRQLVLPRRTFLRGLGAAIALPMLDAMVPMRGLAAQTAARRSPLRMAFIYIPNGVNMSDWRPASTGTNFELTPTLEPLINVKQNIQIVTGLAHDKARANGDGPGDHARANATFLTGCQAYKTAGSNIAVGKSVDVVASEKIGRETRLPSLELGVDKGRTAGSCDSGYACAYQYNLSWRTESLPNPPEVNPRAVFDLLFGTGGDSAQALTRMKRDAERKSILDFAMADANRLQRNLGAGDRAKIDEYLTSVRELEQRIDNSKKFTGQIPDDVTRPEGIPGTYQEHVKTMFDLLALAFQTDNTRIATFLMAHDGSNRPYPTLGVSEGHHDLSHHGGNTEKKNKIARINKLHTTLFAGFLERLKNIREGDGTLLDNCMIVYGSGISDGDRHNHDDLPVILAGGGGGTLKQGRHVNVGRVPMTNLYLSMLDRMGCPTERLGDSTGKLADI